MSGIWAPSSLYGVGSDMVCAVYRQLLVWCRQAVSTKGAAHTSLVATTGAMGTKWPNGLTVSRRFRSWRRLTDASLAVSKWVVCISNIDLVPGRFSGFQEARWPPIHLAVEQAGPQHCLIGAQSRVGRILPRQPQVVCPHQEQVKGECSPVC